MFARSLRKKPGLGVDVVLEMAGHPDAIRTAFDIRPAGRTDFITRTNQQADPLNFSGSYISKASPSKASTTADVSETWYQMTALPQKRQARLHPVITDRIPMKDFSKAMDA